jgi:hypothetical protein
MGTYLYLKNFGIVGTYFKNRNYKNIYQSELWDPSETDTFGYKEKDCLPKLRPVKKFANKPTVGNKACNKNAGDLWWLPPAMPARPTAS